MEIFPQLFMLPQVNDGCRFLAAFSHHESDSTHGNNLAEKCAEVNFNLSSSPENLKSAFRIQFWQMQAYPHEPRHPPTKVALVRRRHQIKPAIPPIWCHGRQFRR